MVRGRSLGDAQTRVLTRAVLEFLRRVHTIDEELRGARIGSARLGKGDGAGAIRLLDGLVVDGLRPPMAVHIWITTEPELDHERWDDPEEAGVVVEFRNDQFFEARGADGSPVLVHLDDKGAFALGCLDLCQREG